MTPYAGCPPRRTANLFSHGLDAGAMGKAVPVTFGDNAERLSGLAAALLVLLAAAARAGIVAADLGAGADRLGRFGLGGAGLLLELLLLALLAALDFALLATRR